MASCGAPRSSPADTGQSDAGDGPAPDVAASDTADASADSQADQASWPPPFTIVALDRARVGSENSTGWPHVGKARADVDWMQGPFADVRLVVDVESTCFPFSKWSSNPPPSGENWPADCDAFDRNFNVVIDDTSAPGSTDTFAFEVIHAITPFGGPEHLEVDLTDLANARPGRHALVADLVSYSDPQGMVTGSNAGWTVSARIDVAPGRAPRNVLAIVPVHLGSLGAGDPFPTLTLNVPPGATGGRLEYRASGHGQGPMGPRCIGPAEEFCDRRHLIFVDGVMADNIGPYRDDCHTLCTVAHQGPVDAGFDYCRENPCGALDSVRAPRANWCPGSMTPPFVWDNFATFAAPGPHTLSFQIFDIVQGGTWLLSAIYTAYGP